LVHGGVRYLQNLDLSKLLESAREQAILAKQAPHLVNEIEFFLPEKNIFKLLYYRLGFLLFDGLSYCGKKKFGNKLKFSKIKLQNDIQKDFPNFKKRECSGGIYYTDCQFDDARFALTLFEKSSENGALILNYSSVEKLKCVEGKVSAVVFIDKVSGKTHEVRSKVIVNATGSESDTIINLDQGGVSKIIDRVQGTHLVLPLKFLGSDKALIIPKTKRDRVFYAIPWLGVLLVGTTETRLDTLDKSSPRQDEIDYLLEEFSLHCSIVPERKDILSVFSGIRPLLKFEEDDSTKFSSREHAIFTSDSGLITIAGGKWTTYRKMAQDVVDLVMEVGNFIKMPSKTSKSVFFGNSKIQNVPKHLIPYGDKAVELMELENSDPSSTQLIHPDLPYRYSQIFWAIQNEHVIHLDDILIRRTRSLILNAKATIEVAPMIAELMAKELGKNSEWVVVESERFFEIARKYTV
jgi:glycerol-3-phosphate dehydrogenase